MNYTYHPNTGNMETNAGMSYAYTYPNAPTSVAPAHGVRQVTGGIVYNGTVTVRAKGTYGCTGWPVMKLYVNGTLRQQWTVNKTSYFNYSVSTSLTTDAQVDVVFTNACTGRTLQVDYVTLPTATGARTVQAESSGTAFDRGTETGGLGENAFDGVNVINGAELMSENGSLRFVVGLNALASGYDANGNMTLRLKDGARYFLSYDAENRLTAVSGTVSASFVYNGDGQRVTATIGTITTTYIGGYFEWQGGAGKSYYFAGGQRVAMRTSEGVKYLLGDHLGSTAVTALASGAFDTETRYYPWGAVRWSSRASPTDYMFTGQQNVASIGLYFYNARWYDSYLNRWIQADSIVPNYKNPVDFDRYAYARNNPVRYVDPTGHCSGDPSDPNNPDIACWAWISTITGHFSNIFIDPLYWTAKELMAVWDALNDHVFLPEILLAESVTLHRREGTRGVGGSHVVNRNNPGVHNIYIFDFAYFSLPDASGISSESSINNFRGVVSHELAHVGITEDSAIQDSYESNSVWWGDIFSPLGSGYNFGPDTDYTAERIAIAAATWEVNPDLFTYNVFLVVSVTDWRLDWVESFVRVPCLIP